MVCLEHLTNWIGINDDSVIVPQFYTLNNREKRRCLVTTEIRLVFRRSNATSMECVPGKLLRIVYELHRHSQISRWHRENDVSYTFVKV